MYVCYLGYLILVISTKEKDTKANCCKIYYLGHLGGSSCQINSLHFYAGAFWCKGLKRMFAWLLDRKAIRVAHSQAGLL